MTFQCSEVDKKSELTAWCRWCPFTSIMYTSDVTNY
nr:MAG TPA: protein of unknown function DUF83 [Caudoviricetes sp.]